MPHIPQKGMPQMPLKDIEIKSLKPTEKPYKKADAGGLYIEVFPNASKLWRWKFRYANKEKRLALGSYPSTSLKEARTKRDAARKLLEEGKDPSLERKREKVTRHFNAANSFADVAREYIETKMVGEGRAPSTILKARWFLEQLNPAIGTMPIAEVDPQMLMAALKRLETKGHLETAKKCRSFASRVFRYGAATGGCASDPSGLLRGALITPKAKHYAAILEPEPLGELLRAIEDYGGSPITRIALQLAPHVYVRSGELRHAEWKEFNFPNAQWDIPAEKMKARRAHSVPLSRQAITLLGELRILTGHQHYLCPSAHGKGRPMSENTLNAALRRMGFTKDEATFHGFRATASSLLNASGLWNPDAIERSLAHGDSDNTRGIYNRANYWDERVKMAQWWSDYLDECRLNRKVISLHAASG